MQTAAERKGERLLTFSIDTEIRFPTPGDLEHFTSALAAFIAQQAAALGAADWADSSLPRRGRPYRIVVGGHPSPREKTDKPKQVPPARIRSQI
jgi:hypothetical protein